MLDDYQVKYEKLLAEYDEETKRLHLQWESAQRQIWALLETLVMRDREIQNLRIHSHLTDDVI